MLYSVSLPKVPYMMYKVIEGLCDQKRSMSVRKVLFASIKVSQRDEDTIVSVNGGYLSLRNYILIMGTAGWKVDSITEGRSAMRACSVDMNNAYTLCIWKTFSRSANVKNKKQYSKWCRWQSRKQCEMGRVAMPWWRRMMERGSCDWRDVRPLTSSKSKLGKRCVSDTKQNTNYTFHSATASRAMRVYELLSSL